MPNHLFFLDHKIQKHTHCSCGTLSEAKHIRAFQFQGNLLIIIFEKKRNTIFSCYVIFITSCAMLYDALYAVDLAVRG